MAYNLPLRSVLIMSSNLRLGIPKGLFPVSLPVKILKALLPSPILTTWPSHNLLHLINPLIIWGERYKLWNLSLWSLLHSLFAHIFATGLCSQCSVQNGQHYLELVQETWVLPLVSLGAHSSVAKVHFQTFIVITFTWELSNAKQPHNALKTILRA